jgi:hypothetical protein
MSFSDDLIDARKRAYAVYRERVEIDPEIKELAHAVLVRAASDLMGGDERDRENKTHLKEENKKTAAKWFYSNRNDWIFSFINICELVDLSPGWIRRQIELGKINAIRRTNRLGRFKRVKK